MENWYQAPAGEGILETEKPSTLSIYKNPYQHSNAEWKRTRFTKISTYKIKTMHEAGTIHNAIIKNISRNTVE